MKKYVRISFLNLSEEQLEHIFKARDELGKAGVTFDTGHDLVNNIHNWEFDWSLKGKIEVRNKN